MTSQVIISLNGVLLLWSLGMFLGVVGVGIGVYFVLGLLVVLIGS